MSATNAGLGYRRSVGVMLINSAGHIFVGQRIKEKEEAWQMPQGGIDDGEAPMTAALRELEEETGVPPQLAEILGETSGWLRYDLPEELIGRVWSGRYRGQEQKWFAARFLGEDADINIETAHPEFRAWRWVTAEELLRAIVPFKAAVYKAVVAAFRPYWRPSS